MWEVIKKAAGQVAGWGGSMLRHSQAIEQMLNIPNEQHAVLALRDYVYGIENETEFGRFRQAIAYMRNIAVQSARNSEGSWGNSFEDRQAYLMAHIQAGTPSPAAVAQQRVQALAVADQLAAGFWVEACAQRQATALGTTADVPQPDTSPAAAKPAAESVRPSVAPSAPDDPHDLTAMLEKGEIDIRALGLFNRIGGGEVSEELLGQLDACSRSYADMLARATGDWPGVTRADLHRSWMQVSEQAGNVCERLAHTPAEAGAEDPFEKWLRSGSDRFEQARSAAVACGDEKEAERLAGKVRQIALQLDGDSDAELLALHKDPAGTEPSLDEAERLLQLGAAKLRSGDSFGALEELKAAERMLTTELGLTPPSDEELRKQIVATLAGFGTAEAVPSQFERSLRVRHLFAQAYSLLADACREAGEPHEAEKYFDLAAPLGSTPERDFFGEQMRAQMQSMLDAMQKLGKQA